MSGTIFRALFQLLTEPAEVPDTVATAALRGELNGRGPDSPRVIVLMCHEERDEVFQLLDEMGARAVDVSTELTTLVPRLQERPRRA